MTTRNYKKEELVMKLYNEHKFTLQEIGEMMPEFEEIAVSRQRILQIILRSQNETNNKTTKRTTKSDS